MASEAPEISTVRPLWQRVLKWIGIVLVGLVLLVGLLVLAIDTQPGRRFLVDRVAGYETASGMKVGIGRIDGSLYGRMVARDITIRDPRGVFAEAGQLTLDWRPFAYLTSSKVDVRELASPEIRVLRMPVLKPVPSDPNAPLLPDIDVMVGRLAIDRIVIEPAVTGRRHVLRAYGSADIASGRAKLDLDARAVAGRGVAGGDVLRLKLDAVPDANRLTIDGTLTAPVGGLVDSYSGLGKPLALTIGGKGDWANWAGRLTGRAGAAPLADLALTARNGAFSLKGDTMPGALMEGPTARLTEPKLAIDLAATLGERRADVKLVARSAALAVDAAGLIDLGNSRFGNFKVDAQLLKPGAIAENVGGRDVRATATLDGAFATPTIAYRLTAAQLGFGTMGIEGLTAEGAARIDADRILIPIKARARRVTGLNAAAGGLLTNLAIDGDLAWSGGRLLSDNLKLKSDKIDATALILADPAKGRYTGAIKGRVNDYRVDGLGRISLTTDAELVPGAQGGFGIRGGFRVVTRSLDNATLRDTLGGNAVTVARFGFDENGVATLTGLRMTAPLFAITGGQGSYNIETGRIAFAARAMSKAYGPLAVTASGTLERPLVKLRAARPGLGADLRDVEAELRGVAAGYAIKATGQSAYGPLFADVLVRSGRGPLAVDIHSARFAGIDFGGSIVQTSAGPFAGTLTLAGSGLNGGVRLSAAGANQRADVDVAASAARIPGPQQITIGSGLIRATATMYPKGPAATGRFLLTDVRQGETSLARAQGRFDYRDGSGSVALAANGRAGVPFDLAAQARLSPTRVVANLKGSANRVAFRLTAPAVVTKAGADWVLAPTTLVVPQGQIEMRGRYGATTDFHARLGNMDVGIVEAFMPGLGLGGRATGTVDYTQAPGATVPTVRARMDIARFTRTAAYVVSAPVDVAMLGTLDGNGGDMRALIRRGGGIVGRMQARLAPLGGGATLSERLFAAPLSGGIRYNGPAEVLWTLTGIAGQELSGPVAVAADFGGRLDRPSLTGIARANALRYENSAYGTVISNIALDGRFTQSRLELVSLTGKAGSGSLSASGTVGLDAASGFPIDLKATLRRAQLARSDALGATVSGNIAVTNSQSAGALIKGDLTIPEARYEIIRQGAAEVAELEGVRRRTDRPQTEAEKQAAAGVPSNWKLDIRVRADNKIFVSGMGLEAEWATDLRVGGTASDPRVVGTLSVVRGTYSFASRRFELANTGKVRFEGGAVTDPSLALAASTTVEGVTATINIGGRAMNPQVTFTSTPSLPQDEVLSRLLFGQSVTSLSPTQAIQLAAALNSLRGSGGGLNPLGKLRSASGIDRLRVLGADKTAGRGTALAAGQYISNDIYVEIITDARGFTATQLEVALSKALSLLSQTGSFGGSSASVRYSKDY
ncbi:translocation/assembly module TamB domain-containing protein [Sphingomonas naphthae]|uniref:Translocation/assembly module TamB domain-containing protein n=1 Tax=Sphingomonas naphthae TaxID=1813468 RepID=A0ABY7TLI8_9SPHN|nr:translocation/assembly module TamB domain-containing protein [Sphingomonas naphthae]WCT73109.1 translocation/assembly module TamB domain-containing protein [Sphingomonas naphthae]